MIKSVVSGIVGFLLVFGVIGWALVGLTKVLQTIRGK